MKPILWVPLAVVTALATAQNIVPSNFTSSTADLEADDSLTLFLTEGPEWVAVSSVLPLTTQAKTLPTLDLAGTVRILTLSSDAVPTSMDVCLISCDSSPGYLGPGQLFNQAQSANASAILFYSTHADYCSLEDYSGSYPWIYSMKSRNSTEVMLKAANTPDPDNDDTVGAAIEYSDQTPVPPPSGGSGNSSPLGPSPTTAVAMIVLYSVTGVITILFLIIILSGAIRAHRHPERYGPRNAAGRPRQSRAKGLARAMLDTLPIVKFSERDSPKPADVELAPAASTRDTVEMATGSLVNEVTHTAPPETHDRRASTEGGIAAATNLEQSSSRDHVGCSICTDDFEEGQDQRVLPCNHRFHPECVDPWLLNVSGTCPLCRIDLLPALSTTEGTSFGGNGQSGVDGDDSEAPPLGAQGTAEERQRMTIRRSIMIGIMGVGRPDLLSREERLRALRELREQRLLQRRREEQAAVAETPEEESRTRRTLRRLARRRTTPNPSVPAEQASTEMTSAAEDPVGGSAR